jgi:hypothetical protein
MVSSLLVEALSSPTDVLLSFYDTYDREVINEFPKAVAKHFSDIFRTDEALLEVRIHTSLKWAKSRRLQSQIPPLSPSCSLSSYRDRALVRFRAMVQDTSSSPEMYLSKLRDGKCGGWGLSDSSQGDGDDTEFDYNDLRDCIVLWAVSVPGETEWYQSASNGDSTDQREPTREDFLCCD